MEALRNMPESELEKLGIPVGARYKIISRLKKKTGPKCKILSFSSIE